MASDGVCKRAGDAERAVHTRQSFACCVERWWSGRENSPLKTALRHLKSALAPTLASGKLGQHPPQPSLGTP